MSEEKPHAGERVLSKEHVTPNPNVKPPKFAIYKKGFEGEVFRRDTPKKGK